MLSLDDFDFAALLSPELRRLVGDNLEEVHFSFGAEVVRQGERLDWLYLIRGGRLRELWDSEEGTEISLGELGPGDVYGEFGLYEESSPHTLRAKGAVHAYRLDLDVLRALMRSEPDLAEFFELRAREMQLGGFLKTRSSFARLPAPAIQALLRELEPLELEKGERVFEQDDPPGPLYVVEHGRLRMRRAEGDAEPRDVEFLRAGDVFAELSALRGLPQTGTVEAVEPSRVLRLNAETLQALMSAHPEFRAALEEEAAQLDYAREARVPLDFSEEIVTAAEGPADRPAPVVPALGDAAPEAPRVGGRRIRRGRFPHVHQVDEMDCGAACLAMVCRAFGRKVSLPRVRTAVGTGPDGTSLLGIAHGAEQLGLQARTLKASRDRLDDLTLPAIVHWDAQHWVVLYEVENGSVRLADPGSGLRKMPRDELLEHWSGYTIELQPTPALEAVPKDTLPLAQLAPFFRPHRRRLALAFGLGLVAAGLSMLLPVVTEVIFDDVVPDRDYRLLNLILIAMAGTLVLITAVTVLQRYVLARTAVRIDASTLDFITGRLFALPLSYFEARRTGDIQRRLDALRQMREFLVESGVEALMAFAQLFVALILMFIYSPVLALAFLATAPLYAAMLRFSAKKLRPEFDRLEESFGRYQSGQIDAIKGIETVKAMAAEPILRKRLLNQFDRLANRLFRAQFMVTLYEGAIGVATFLSVAVFLYVGALQVLAGNMSVGELVSFNTLVLLANTPILILLTVWDQIQISSVLLNRLDDILEHEPEQAEDAKVRAVPTLSGRVEFCNVSFWYPGPSPKPILDDIDLQVEPGQTVAIVGRSGSGKTTLVKCLCGLLMPTRGTIEFDGVALTDLRLQELRRQIGYVLQENHLFEDTIARNIALGRDDLELEGVIAAARAANAHEFIERLPFGYDTKVGESGLRLSGGQRQRIAIARALYDDPPILIFDEATSALDTESERAVQQNMHALLGARTAFVIAHRLSTIREADLIVVLEAGRIVERGTHDELIARRGLYFYLASQQLGL